MPEHQRLQFHSCGLITAPGPCCAGGGAEYLVRASYLEIYNEEIRDLMGRNPEAKLELKESGDRGVYVRDLTQFVVKNVAEINSVLQVGLGAGAEGKARGGCRTVPLSTVLKLYVKARAQDTATARYKDAKPMVPSSMPPPRRQITGSAATRVARACRLARRTAWSVLLP